MVPEWFADNNGKFENAKKASVRERDLKKSARGIRDLLPEINPAVEGAGGQLTPEVFPEYRHLYG